MEIPACKQYCPITTETELYKLMRSIYVNFSCLNEFSWMNPQEANGKNYKINREFKIKRLFLLFLGANFINAMDSSIMVVVVISAMNHSISGE